MSYNHTDYLTVTNPAGMGADGVRGSLGFAVVSRGVEVGVRGVEVGAVSLAALQVFSR